MIVYGYRKRNKVMGKFSQPCPRCQQNVPQTFVRSRNWFTLFWIPVFPVTKKTLVLCSNCKAQFEVKNEFADQLFPKNPPAQVLAQAPREPVQPLV